MSDKKDEETGKQRVPLVKGNLRWVPQWKNLLTRGKLKIRPESFRLLLGAGDKTMPGGESRPESLSSGAKPPTENEEGAAQG